MGAACTKAGREEAAFLKAAKDGDCVQVQQAILRHVDWGYKAQTWNGQSVFHLAARYGRVDVLETVVEAVRFNPAGPEQWKKLLRMGHSTDAILKAYANLQDARCQTPLHIACIYGNAEVATFLLQLGATPWVWDELGGRTPLHYAASMGHVDVIRVVLSHGAAQPTGDALRRPNTTRTKLADICNDSGYTPLHYAVWAGNISSIRALVSYEASLSARNVACGSDWVVSCLKCTPLHLAAHKGTAEVVKLLLSAYVQSQVPQGSDTPAANDRRRRDPRRHVNAARQLPYHVAVGRGHSHLAELLHPDVPFSFILSPAEMESTARLYGVTKLAVLAARTLQAKLVADIEAALALMSTAGVVAGGVGGGGGSAAAYARARSGSLAALSGAVAAAAAVSMRAGGDRSMHGGGSAAAGLDAAVAAAVAAGADGGGGGAVALVRRSSGRQSSLMGSVAADVLSRMQLTLTARASHDSAAAAAALPSTTSGAGAAAASSSSAAAAAGAGAGSPLAAGTAAAAAAAAAAAGGKCGGSSPPSAGSTGTSGNEEPLAVEPVPDHVSCARVSNEPAAPATDRANPTAQPPLPLPPAPISPFLAPARGGAPGASPGLTTAASAGGARAPPPTFTDAASAFALFAAEPFEDPAAARAAAAAAASQAQHPQHSQQQMAPAGSMAALQRNRASVIVSGGGGGSPEPAAPSGLRSRLRGAAASNSTLNKVTPSRSRSLRTLLGGGKHRRSNTMGGHPRGGAAEATMSDQDVEDADDLADILLALHPHDEADATTAAAGNSLEQTWSAAGAAAAADASRGRPPAPATSGRPESPPPTRPARASGAGMGFWRRVSGQLPPPAATTAAALPSPPLPLPAAPSLQHALQQHPLLAAHSPSHDYSIRTEPMQTPEGGSLYGASLFGGSLRAGNGAAAAVAAAAAAATAAAGSSPAAPPPLDAATPFTPMGRGRLSADAGRPESSDTVAQALSGGGVQGGAPAATAAAAAGGPPAAADLDQAVAAMLANLAEAPQQVLRRYRLLQLTQGVDLQDLLRDHQELAAVNAAAAAAAAGGAVGGPLLGGGGSGAVVAAPPAGMASSLQRARSDATSLVQSIVSHQGWGDRSMRGAAGAGAGVGNGGAGNGGGPGGVTGSGMDTTTGRGAAAAYAAASGREHRMTWHGREAAGAAPLTTAAAATRAAALHHDGSVHGGTRTADGTLCPPFAATAAAAASGSAFATSTAAAPTTASRPDLETAFAMAAAAAAAAAGAVTNADAAAVDSAGTNTTLPEATSPLHRATQPSAFAGAGVPSPFARSLSRAPTASAASITAATAGGASCTTAAATAGHLLHALSSQAASEIGEGMCGVCFDQPDVLAIASCGHRLCTDCSRELCKLNTFKPALCPFCRGLIGGFKYMAHAQAR